MIDLSTDDAVPQLPLHLQRGRARTRRQGHESTAMSARAVAVQPQRSPVIALPVSTSMFRRLPSNSSVTG